MHVFNYQLFFPILILTVLLCIRSEKPKGINIKNILFRKLILPFIVQINCSCDLINISHRKSEQFWKQNMYYFFQDKTLTNFDQNLTQNGHMNTQKNRMYRSLR